MKAAIYVRKSKDTLKGESNESQKGRGKAFCEMKGWDYQIYEDFDVSARTLNRPAFIEMMNDIHNKKINALVCYKLDRVSRSVNDFSSLITELTDLGVAFISIKENFDTSTPMGRAMMMITSVFAQLERETIAERVKDNMIDRAKKGKWNGGRVPLGYTAKRTKVTENGKNINKTVLVVDEYTSVIIKLLFNKALEGHSFRTILAEMNEELPGLNLSYSAIQTALSNPLYCVADKRAYEYFKDFNLTSSEKDFTGDYGLYRYSKKNANRKTNDKSDWIISIGEHEGIISSRDFIKVQKLIQERTC